MFSKQEASQLKKEFWTVFGQYMNPVPSFEGEKVNWMNYKTGEKDIFFKMDANQETATVAIEVCHRDFAVQELYFEQFKLLQAVFNKVAAHDWECKLHDIQDGRVISRIYSQVNNVSIFKKADWPLLISFFKPRMIALDQFWSSARYAFESLH